MGDSDSEQDHLLKSSASVVQTERVCGSYRLLVTLLCMSALMLCFAHQSSMGSTMVCMTVAVDNGDDNNSRNITPANTTTTTTISSSTIDVADAYGENVTLSPSLSFPLTSSSALLSESNNGTQLSPYRYNWDKSTQGWIHSSLFIGYYVTQLPSGILASMYGGRRIATVGLLVSSVAQLVTPVAASAGVVWLCVVRAVCGFSAGFIYAPTFGLLANWVPSCESSLLFGLAGTGMELGAVLSFSLSALTCDMDLIGGWPLVYYIIGGLGVLTVLVFSCLVSDLPSHNRWISKRERHYIETLVGQAGGHGHKDEDSHDAPLTNKIPVWSILTSMPVWAIVVSQTGSDWFYYLLITVMPSFMEEVMHLSNTTISLLVGLPFLAIIPTIYAGGTLADYLRRKKILSTTAVRKLADFICKILPGSILIALGYLKPGQEVVFIVLYVLACMLLAFIYVSWITNPVDLSPAYTGFITSICETGSMWIAIVVPILVENITKDKTAEQWQVVLFISGGLQFFTFIFYVIFGSSVLQSWGRPDTCVSVSATTQSADPSLAANLQTGSDAGTGSKTVNPRKYSRQQSNPYMSDSELGRRGIYRAVSPFRSDAEEGGESNSHNRRRRSRTNSNIYSYAHAIAVTSDDELNYLTMNGASQQNPTGKSDYSYESMDFSHAEPVPSSDSVMESEVDNAVYENVTFESHGDHRNTATVGIVPASRNAKNRDRTGL